MAQLVVRNLDDALKERLRRTAAAHGRRMEEEVRVILTTTLSGEVSTESDRRHLGLGTQIHNLFAGVDAPDEFFDALEEIRHSCASVLQLQRADHRVPPGGTPA